MRAAAVSLLLLLAIACGKGGMSPSGTSSSRVVGTLSGKPLAGVTVDGPGGVSATTDAGGNFSLPVEGAARVTIHGPGIQTHVTSSGSTLDAIELSDFNLGFYREFARDAYDNPATVRPLFRRTSLPRVYLGTVDDRGAAISKTQLDSADEAFRNAGWPVSVAGVDRTNDDRTDVITVRWLSGSQGTVCGSVDGFRMTLSYQTAGCTCNGLLMPRVIKHELGHILGYSHTDSANDLMFGTLLSCDAAPSARELAHARIMLKRPNANLDEDQDP